MENCLCICALLAVFGLVLSKPLSCVVDNSVFQHNVDIAKLKGSWFIDQTVAVEHVGKWKLDQVMAERDYLTFYDAEKKNLIKGDLTYSKEDETFTYKDKTHTSLMRVVYTDYRVVIIYEVLKFQSNHVGDVGQGHVYLMSLGQKLTTAQRDELLSRVHKLAPSLCLATPHAMVSEEGSGESSGETGSGDIMESGDTVMGSGETVMGSGEESGDESGELGSGEAHVHSGDVMTSSGESSGEKNVEVVQAPSEGSGESSGEHICANVLCEAYCPYGYQTNEQGCGTCDCISETCTLRRDAINDNIKKGLDMDSPLLGAEPPVCEEDGSYIAKQCTGSVCYCVSSNGKAISEFLDVDRWDSEHLTCGCAREHNTQKSLGAEEPTVMCDAIGNYQHVQCNKGMCYCVDPSSGAPIEGSQLPLEEKKTLVEKCSVKEVPEKTVVEKDLKSPEKETEKVETEIHEIPEIIEKVTNTVEPPK